MAGPAWIAVDWGTSRLRLWVMSDMGEVLAERQSADGMGHLQPDEFEGALRALLVDELSLGVTLPVVCCGMVGAAQGWQPAPYALVPCAPPGMAQAVRAPVRDGLLDVVILPGVKQSMPADVMRGEETQIRGYLAQDPLFEGCLCLPGTHTKWVEIKVGRIEHFQTCMSGELFALLSQQSVLRHSVGGDAIDHQAFSQAVTSAASDPAMLPTELFRIRAAGLLNDTPPELARGRLSGLLIGIELAAARDFWLDRPVRLIGDTQLCTLYQQALHAIGREAELVDAASLTRQGLTAAYLERSS